MTSRKGHILPLALEGVAFSANGNRLLGPIDLRIEGGPRTVIMGPNGAGKSLLLRICHGLLLPTEGKARWLGAGDRHAEAPRRRQAMVFQRPVLLRRTVLANVGYALALAGIPRPERRTLSQDALKRFGLGALANRPARVLSGGEQQRLALARAWAVEPEVLFLDEPTAALDPAATKSVEDAVNDFHAAGCKIVMTTHDLGQARRLADEIIFIAKGRILERAPAAIFFSAPSSPEAAAFIAGELVA